MRLNKIVDFCAFIVVVYFFFTLNIYHLYIIYQDCKSRFVCVPHRSNEFGTKRTSALFQINRNMVKRFVCVPRRWIRRRCRTPCPPCPVAGSSSWAPPPPCCNGCGPGKAVHKPLLKKQRKNYTTL